MRNNRGWCLYVMRAAQRPSAEHPVGVTAVYCGKPCRFTMKKDDDKNRTKKYDAFCPEHRTQVDNEVDE